MAILDDELNALNGEVLIPGSVVLNFMIPMCPGDLTNRCCRERGLRIDEDGFAAAMAEQA